MKCESPVVGNVYLQNVGPVGAINLLFKPERVRVVSLHYRIYLSNAFRFGKHTESPWQYRPEEVCYPFIQIRIHQRYWKQVITFNVPTVLRSVFFPVHEQPVVDNLVCKEKHEKIIVDSVKTIVVFENV